MLLLSLSVSLKDGVMSEMGVCPNLNEGKVRQQRAFLLVRDQTYFFILVHRLGSALSDSI